MGSWWDCEIDNQRHLDHHSSRLDDWTPSRSPDTFEMLQGFWLHDPLVTLHFTALSHLLLLLSFSVFISADFTVVWSWHYSSTIAVIPSVSSQRLSNVLFRVTFDKYRGCIHNSSVGSKISRIYPTEWNKHCLRDRYHTQEMRQQ